MDLTAISKQLTDAIGLSSAPIALSFLDEVPRGITGIRLEGPIRLYLLDSCRKGFILRRR